ncbi:hypothetical protein Mgra_00001214 [Meloidogyne graminicola]|uniref:Uncharacterized protein n=1 Tax=Meloidogyne graminicola TaxID=189291 RepID=A0A8T0A146_9BILA|nr:hypothetical protein Mgra_00001214 [Meloidogyne graminicola]
MLFPYVKVEPFLKRAAVNKNYYPSYALYGASLFLLTVYICDWKRFAKLIPVYRQRSFRLSNTSCVFLSFRDCFIDRNEQIVSKIFDCLASAASHLKNQQSMPNLWTPLHHYSYKGMR